MRSTGCCESGGLCGLTHLEGKVATGHPVDVGGELVRVAAVLELELGSNCRANKFGPGSDICHDYGHNSCPYAA